MKFAFVTIQRDFGHSVDSTVEEMLDYRNTGAAAGFGKLILLSIVTTAIIWAIKKRKIKLTGRHKKQEFNIGSFPSRSGNTKYRDS